MGAPTPPVGPGLGQVPAPAALSGMPRAYRCRFDANPDFFTILKGVITLYTDPSAWYDAATSDIAPDVAADAWTRGAITFEADMAQIGTVFATAAASVPPYSLLCDGSTYARVDYPDLYAVLDTAFIIDADTFSVPDLRGRVILGTGTGGGLSSYATGDTGGEESHTLSTGELPSHSHTEGNATATAITIGPGAPAPSAIPSIGITGNTGGGGAHENRQPYLALQWYIVYA